MTDIFGTEVNVGDKVVYSRGGQSDQGLYHGDIISIECVYTDRHGVDIMGVLIKDSSGRKQQKLRTKVLSLTPYILRQPELFI